MPGPAHQHDDEAEVGYGVFQEAGTMTYKLVGGPHAGTICLDKPATVLRFADADYWLTRRGATTFYLWERMRRWNLTKHLRAV